MAYQVLARKYRPQRFADVAGQDHVTRTLQNALEQNRIAHGYIFSGHRGIGKTTIARILACALNCQNAIGSALRPTPEPCLVCDACTEIRAGNAVDVIEIDAATNRGIDEIRELRDAARYRPARDRFKIYILDEAHQITDAAFNALLKTLEEPPDHIVFMMATTEPENIPQTIRSRCQHFSFHAVKLDDILAELRGIAAHEGVLADEAALSLLAEAGDGSMRDALSIMDQAIASAPTIDGKAQLSAAEIRELMGTVPNTVFEDILESVARNDTSAVLTTAGRLLDAGNSSSQIARQFVRYLRNCIVAKIAALTEESNTSELLQISPDERRRAIRTAMLFTEEELTRFLGVMLRTFDDLGFRQEQRLHLEMGLIKLVHLQRLLPVEEFLSQLPKPTANPTPRTIPPPRAAIANTPAQEAGAPRISSDTWEARGTRPSTSRFETGGNTAGLPAKEVQAAAKPTTTSAATISEALSSRSEAKGSAFSSTAASNSLQPLSSRPGPQLVEGEAEGPASKSAPTTDLPRNATESGAPASAQPKLGSVDTESSPVVLSEVRGFSRANTSPSDAMALAAEAMPVGRIEAFPQTEGALALKPRIATQGNITEIDPSTNQNPHLQPNSIDLTAGTEDYDPSWEGLAAPDADPEATVPGTDVPPTEASQLQAAAVEALFATRKNNSAAEQLEESTWTIANGDVHIATTLSKPMMATIFRPDIESIIKTALREKGLAGARIVFVPAALDDRPKAPKKPRTGSVQAKALEHPTVQQAQRLFNAEVTNVFDLRKD